MKKTEHQPHITRYQKYLYGLLSVICCTVMVLNLIIPDSVRSEVENRPLAGFPKLSISALQSGRYADQFEDYVSDQFLGRNTLFHVNYLSAGFAASVKLMMSIWAKTLCFKTRPHQQMGFWKARLKPSMNL